MEYYTVKITRRARQQMMEIIQYIEQAFHSRYAALQLLDKLEME